MSQTQPVRAQVIPNGNTSGAYDMYDLSWIRSEAVFLRGPMLLELEEEFMLRISSSNGASVTVPARVADVRRDEEPGIIVDLFELSPEQRNTLQLISQQLDAARTNG